MTREEYRTERLKRGTQQQVARLLGVHEVTVARRELGVLPINPEAAAALRALPERPDTASGTARRRTVQRRWKPWKRARLRKKLRKIRPATN